ncbi:MAG: alpha/beta fold hydrolase [Betaproteobacteria bacterium]|nr:alpha/beta fold hydrolase [Betaproteobacteria bacterium]
MAKRAVLLIPGLGGKGSFWNLQVAALSGRFDPIAVDLPGLNTIEKMASHIVGVLDEKKIARCHVVGQSTGGAIAQVIAQDHPQRVQRLVLSGTWSAPSVPFKAQFELRTELLQKLGPAPYSKLAALLAWPNDWLEAHPELLNAPADPAEAPALLARMEAILAFDRSRRLGSIKAPTLVICAADDNLVPLAHSRRLVAGILGATLRVLPTGGHFPQAALTDTYNSVLLDFLEKTDDK